MEKKTVVAGFGKKLYNKPVHEIIERTRLFYTGKGKHMKKKIMIVLALVLSACMLTACGSSTCKKCGKEVYKDGLCQEHYYEEHPLEALGDLASGLKDLLG